MDERLVLRIAADGSLSLEGEAMTFETFEERLEKDKANNVTTLIAVVTSLDDSEKPEWHVVKSTLDLLMRFDRSFKGFVGTNL
jgi:hypothetical protein